MTTIDFAVIGGSGLYNMPALTHIEEIEIDTPFGKPSDSIIIGTLHGKKIAFLPRHGRGHLLNPSEVPYRANIYALKSLGTKFIIGVSACGSLREELQPGHILIPDQIYDNTKGKRASSFYDNGLVAHISLAHPFSPELSKILTESVKQAGGTAHEGGTFITIEGPRFSTKAESNLFRQWGMSIVGMTTSPEAFLAAEAEIAYACMAHITDYDVWHESEEAVTVEMIIKVLQNNTTLAQEAISLMVKSLDKWNDEFAAHNGMANTLLTNPIAISAETKSRFKLLMGKYLPK